MFKTCVRATVLTGVALAAMVLPARAAADSCCGSPAPVSAAPCAPAFRTITVTEWVSETYSAVRTSYRTECATETYTAYKTECATETRTRQLTINKMVPEVHTAFKTVYTCVPTVETRTSYKTVVSYVPETIVTRKCVDQGHWECREVPVKESCISKLKKHFHKPDCCECPAPVCTKTVKVWCPNKVWIETPVTVTKKVCSTVPYTVQVTVNKMVPSQQSYQYTTYKCVPEIKVETYTVQVPHQVAYQATRTVSRCVPVQETVQLCRMVPRCVTKVVPVESCCTTICCSSGHKFFAKKAHKHHAAPCCD
jgi:hypothetical protein